MPKKEFFFSFQKLKTNKTDYVYFKCEIHLKFMNKNNRIHIKKQKINHGPKNLNRNETKLCVA